MAKPFFLCICASVSYTDIHIMCKSVIFTQLVAILERLQFFVLANLFFVLAKCVHIINSLYGKFHSLYAPQSMYVFLPVSHLTVPVNDSTQNRDVIVQKLLQIAQLNAYKSLKVPFTANIWQF